MPLRYSIRHRTGFVTAPGSSKGEAIEIRIDNRAATREAIFNELRRKGVIVKEASDWHGDAMDGSEHDWDYEAIALHHAGNSFGCSENPIAALRRVKEIDDKRFGQISYHYAVDCQGTVYEALDIRRKGMHVGDQNTGKIGIVLLADLSEKKEVEKHGPRLWGVLRTQGWRRFLGEYLGERMDAFDVTHDTVTRPQEEATMALVEALASVFAIKTLGGHREFANVRGDRRACPGAHGLALADRLRRTLGFATPARATLP